MNDRQLQELVRMAVELDEFESAVAAHERGDTGDVIGRVDSGSSVRTHERVARTPARRWVIAVGSLAAAAALTLAVLVPLSRPTPVVPLGSGGGAVAHGGSPAPVDVLPALPVTPNHTDVATLPNAPSVEKRTTTPQVAQCIVLAIFRDALGSVGCVQWQPHDLNGRPQVSDIQPGELLGVKFGPPCINNADGLVLVALSGPGTLLPTTDESAHALASCLVESRNPCNEDPAAYALAAAQCLPADVAIKVESMPMRSR